jgi:dolichol-phosphate mannosyltransferase
MVSANRSTAIPGNSTPCFLDPMIPVSIVLPTYNECENILSMIDDIGTVLGAATFEVIVVDDNSPDGTSTLVKNAAVSLPWLRLITRTTDHGLIPSISEGIAAARHGVCVWMDADCSMKAEAIPRLLAEIEGGADLVIGSRYIEGGGVKGSDGKTKNLIPIRRHLRGTGDSFLQVVLSLLGNRVLHRFLTRHVTDYTSGCYAVRQEVVEGLGLGGTYVDYCIRFAYMASLRGHVVREVPIVVHPRIFGQSKTAISLFGLIAISFGCLRVAVSLKLAGNKIAALGSTSRIPREENRWP